MFVGLSAPAFAPCTMACRYLSRDSLPFRTSKSQLGLASGAAPKAMLRCLVHRLVLVLGATPALLTESCLVLRC